MLFANGLVVSGDGATLIVAETRANPGRLTAFDIDRESGALSNRRTLVDFDATVFPDGLAIDAEDGVWVASPFSAEVIRVDSGGAISDRLAVADPYAVALGGADGRDLFVCTSGTWLPEQAARERSGAIRRLRVAVPAALGLRGRRRPRRPAGAAAGLRVRLRPPLHDRHADGGDQHRALEDLRRPRRRAGQQQADRAGAEHQHRDDRPPRVEAAVAELRRAEEGGREGGDHVGGSVGRVGRLDPRRQHDAGEGGDAAEKTSASVRTRSTLTPTRRVTSGL